jgi:fructose-1,6-bisphosphatase/inositol monophosphatase family enzyme
LFKNHQAVTAYLPQKMTKVKYSPADPVSKVDAIAEAMRIFSLASHRAQLEAAVEDILNSQEGKVLL